MLGYTVAERFWRAPVKRAHKTFRFLGSYLSDSHDPLAERADALIAKIAGRPQSPNRFGVACRRLGQERFEELIAIALAAAIGSFELSEDAASGTRSPTRILARLLGVEAGQHKRRVPLSPILEATGEAVEENVASMAKLLPQISKSISGTRLSEAALSEVRDELGAIRFFCRCHGSKQLSAGVFFHPSHPEFPKLARYTRAGKGKHFWKTRFDQIAVSASPDRRFVN